MKRFGNLLRQAEFHVLLFFIGFTLLNWPVLGIFRFSRPEALLAYVYVLWAIAILLLFLVSRIAKESASGDNDKKRTDDGA